MQRRWAAALVAAGLVLAAMAVAYAAGQVKAAQAAEVLRARRFELVDRKGRLRAELSQVADGSPCLSLRDVRGKARAQMALLEDGTALLTMNDAKGVNRVWMMETDPAGILFVRDAQGEAVWHAP
jgi:hypothetical protein